MARDGADGPFALRCAGIEAGQSEMGAGLVDPDQIRRVEVEREIETEGGAQGVVALGRRQRLL
jgi:hypothetical protein